MGATRENRRGAAAGVLTHGDRRADAAVDDRAVGRGQWRTAGAVVGAAVGASGSNLADFGIPEEHRESYEKRLAADSVLVAVRTDDEDESEKANAAMEQAGAKDTGLFRLTKKIS